MPPWNQRFEYHSKLNGKDAYESDSGQFLYYMTNHWYISRILGSQQLISYAISSEICPENIEEFMEYDFEFGIYISSSKRPLCVEDETTTKASTFTTAESTTMMSTTSKERSCARKPKIKNGFWECDFSDLG